MAEEAQAQQTAQHEDKAGEEFRGDCFCCKAKEKKSDPTVFRFVVKYEASSFEKAKNEKTEVAKGPCPTCSKTVARIVSKDPAKRHNGDKDELGAHRAVPSS